MTVCDVCGAIDSINSMPAAEDCDEILAMCTACETIEGGFKKIDDDLYEESLKEEEGERRYNLNKEKL